MGSMTLFLCLLPSHREPATDQSKDTSKIQLSKPMAFIRVPCRNMSERLLTEAEMTQRQLHHLCPPQHEWQFIESGNLKHTTQLKAVQQVGGCPFQLAQLVWPFPRHLGCSLFLPGSCCLSLLFILACLKSYPQ